MFDIEKLKQGQIACSDNIIITHQLFIELGEFIKKHSTLTLSALAKWSSKMFNIPPPTEASMYRDFKQLKLEKDKLRRNPIAREKMLQQPYVFPMPKETLKSESKSAGSLPSTSQSNSVQRISIDSDSQFSQKSSFDKSVTFDLIDCYNTMSTMTLALNGLQNSLDEAINEADNLKSSYKKDVNSLTYQLGLMRKKYETVRDKLSETVSRHQPRNVNKREARKDLQILEQQNRIRELEEENRQAALDEQKPEDSLQEALRKYEKERQRVQYMKRVQKARAESNDVSLLKERVSYLENEREELNERIDELMGEKEIKVFKNGRYFNEIRMVYYDLSSLNVSIDNCRHVVKTVLETLANRKIDRLPQKSVAATMMVEARLLAQIQASEAMLKGDRNVLHTDGTKSQQNLAHFL